MSLKTILIGFLCIAVLIPDISEVRERYREAASNEKAARELHSDLKGVTKQEEKLLLAYKGAVTALLADYASTIKDKKTFFKEGVTYLEYAVTQEPENVEIRFVRLSVKENAPKITGYKKGLKADKDFILKNLSRVKSAAVKKYIKGYISESKVFTEAEKQSVLDD